MSRAKERHAPYYLQYIESHPEEWVWFDGAWPQIPWAWKWVSQQTHDEMLTPTYILTFYKLQNRLCGMRHYKLAVFISRSLVLRETAFLDSLNETTSILSSLEQDSATML